MQAEVNINTPDHAWRSGHGLRPYIKDAQKILSKAHETQNPRITQQKIDFLHLPIIDGNVTTDSAMNRLVDDCCERVLKGEKLYIHCWGGHGRTGTLVAVMLGRLYNLPYTTALRYTQAFHDSRVYPQGVRSPQTPVQRAQVRRLLTLQSGIVSSAPSAFLAPSKPAASKPGSYNNNKPSSILSAANARASVADADRAQRSSSTPPSPLRTRPIISSGVGNRYPVRGVGESPLKANANADALNASDQSYLKSPTAAGDRLASDFGKLQTSGGTAASILERNGVSLPFMMQKSSAGRSTSAQNLLRRSVVQEVNVR